MSDDNKNLEDVFHAAVDIESSEQRSSFLDEVCADSPELRKQVDELLKVYERAENFLEQSPDQFALTIAGSRNIPEQDITQPPTPKRLHVDNTFNEQLPRYFGDYELLEKIAHGGMGVVYKARQVSLNRNVAIKMILAGHLAGDEEVKRFYIEAEAAAVLDHPGIVPVFDVGSCEGQHFFSMGYVDGVSLAAKIKEGPLPPRVAAMYVKKIAAAAHAAHERGIVHRDLKPGNVLLDNSGEPRVTDFGLAKRVETSSELTTTGMVIGTPSYMPPEQASGKLDQINAGTDVYSLGAILYALLTGRPPFEGKTQIETLMLVLQEEPVAPRQVVPAIPKDIEAICLKCLEKKAADRYRTAAELAEDLQRFLAGEPIGARNDLLRRLRKWTTREPVLAAHLVAILAMMIMIIINYWSFGRTEKSLQILWVNEKILAGWAVAAILLQKTHNLISPKHVVPLIWAAVNPLFATVTLWANEAPRGALLSIYLLLIVTTGFFRRVELVAITSVSSLVGYISLLIIVPEPETVFPHSYKVIFALTLVVTGLMLGFQALRLQRLSQKDKS